MSVDPATTQDNALPLNYRLGEYLVRKVLGRGGFGFTYLAQDTKLGAEVAIKEYFPQSFAARQPNQTIAPLTSGASGGVDDYRWGLEQFLKEARALAKFKHNNIVRVLRFMEANGTAYMVMEYEAGQSLSDYLRTHGGFLAEPLLLKIFLPILNGLQAVHEAGLLHLDIKPGNIYLRRDGRPLLIDFGSARQVRAGAKTAHQTALTPGYCAPEQYPGRGELGAAADIYSIGATLYRCVTGKPPIDALQRLQTYERSRVDPLMPASKFDRPKYSAPIRATIDAALRLTALDRPRAAAALQNGLMGKGMEEPKKAEAGAYGSGFIGIIRTAAVHTKRRIYRSPMEKTLALLVFVATMMVVIPKILIDTGYLTKETLFNTIDTTVAQVAALGPAAKRWVDEQITGRPALDTPTPVASPPRRSAPAPAAPKIPPFAPQKRTAATLDMQGVAVTGVALLQDNKLIAAAGSDGSVRIWRRDGGELVHARTDRTTTPVVLAASADGRWLVLTGKDNSIELWDAQTEKPAGTLPGHSAEISALAFSLDGKYLVSAALDKTVSLWHVG
ncbi:MAG: protein kinase, partial [Pseudomonadota bacterium]